MESYSGTWTASAMQVATSGFCLATTYKPQICINLLVPVDVVRVDSAWMETRPAEWKPSISHLELFAQFNLWMLWLHAMELNRFCCWFRFSCRWTARCSVNSPEFPLLTGIDNSEISFRFRFQSTEWLATRVDWTRWDVSFNCKTCRCSGKADNHRKLLNGLQRFHAKQCDNFQVFQWFFNLRNGHESQIDDWKTAPDVVRAQTPNLVDFSQRKTFFFVLFPLRLFANFSSKLKGRKLFLRFSINPEKDFTD